MMIGSPVFDGLLDRSCVGIIVQCCFDECGQFLVARKSERKDLGSRDLMYPRLGFCWQEFLHPIDWVLRDLRSISVGRQAQEYLRHGQSISLGIPVIDAAYLEPFRAYSLDGHFLALVRLDRPTNTWQPVKVFNIETPSPLAPDCPAASSQAEDSSLNRH